MPWFNLMMVIVGYCGSTHYYKDVKEIDKCRIERSDCIRRGADRHVLNENAVDLVNTCLSNPDQFTGPLPPPPPETKKKAKK